MSIFREKYKELEHEVLAHITALIEEQGELSKLFESETVKVLKIKDDNHFTELGIDPYSKMVVLIEPNGYKTALETQSLDYWIDLLDFCIT